MSDNEPYEPNDGAGPAASGGELDRVVSTIRRHLLLITVCVASLTFVAIGGSLVQTKKYTATASMLFRDPGFAQSVFGTGTDPFSGGDSTRQAATNVELVGLEVVSARTAEKLDTDITAGEVAQRMEIAAEGESDVVSISATDEDPAAARRIANTFALEYISLRANADKAGLLAAKKVADRQFSQLSPAEQSGPRGEQLSRGAEKLGILASLQTGNAELVQPALEPSSPSSPKTRRNAVFGLLTGLLFGVGLAFVSDLFNRRLRTTEEVQRIFGLPLLGAVPDSESIAGADGQTSARPLPFREEEAFRMVRASLRYFNVDHEVRSLVVISSAAKAGKSTVAWNLARVAAKSARVVVLETDFRNPSFSATHKLPASPGLAEVLTHQLSVDDAIQTVPIDENGDSQSELSVVTAGSIPPNPAELIESQGMVEVLLKLRNDFDLLIVDTAPIGVVSDAFPLIKHVDGVLAVVRMEVTTRETAEELRDQLLSLGAPTLGVVANGTKEKRRQRYGYGYYGDYERQAEEARAGSGAMKTPS